MNADEMRILLNRQSCTDYMLGYLFVFECHGLYARFIRVNPRLNQFSCTTAPSPCSIGQRYFREIEISEIEALSR